MKALIDKYRIDSCTQCNNECADACPVYRFYGTWHPQQLAEACLASRGGKPVDHRLIWCCVNCRACSDACPFDVEFGGFVRELRIGRKDRTAAFEDLIGTYQRMQAGMPGAGSHVSGKKGGKKPKSPDWADDTMELGQDDGVALFVGCIPFFQEAFGRPDGFNPIEMARAAVMLLNRAGISPVLFEDERCCGRDLYDTGDGETFRKLAEHNISLIDRYAVSTVITICPKCAYTLDRTYRDEFGALPFEVRHITEVLAEHLDDIQFREEAGKLTFHDPCYLSRYRAVVEPPRAIVKRLSSDGMIEMERHGRSAPCCGAGSWTGHGPHTRALVNERLVEAREAGADTIVTACPKCLLLFNEVVPEGAWRQASVEVKDLLMIAADLLVGDPSGGDGEET